MWVCVGNVLTARCDDPKPILIAKGDADGIPKQPQSAIGANGTIHVPNGDGSVVVFWETKLEGQSAILSIPLIRGAVKP